MSDIEDAIGVLQAAICANFNATSVKLVITYDDVVLSNGIGRMAAGKDKVAEYLDDVVRDAYE